jgi:hypothetical protein
MGRAEEILEIAEIIGDIGCLAFGCSLNDSSQ